MRMIADGMDPPNPHKLDVHVLAISSLEPRAQRQAFLVLPLVQFIRKGHLRIVIPREKADLSVPNDDDEGF